MKYSIVQKLIPIKKNLPNRRGGGRITKVRFLVSHDTGCLDVPANNFYRNYINNPNISASAHIFVDDKEIIEVIPAFVNPEKAWHVLYNVTKDNELYKADANDAAIGIELCWFTDKTRSQKAYEKYVWILAYLCMYHGLNPSTDIIGHETLDKGRKIDPSNGLKYSGHTYQDLIKDVIKEYQAINNGVDDVVIDKSFIKKMQVTAKPTLNIRELPNSNSTTKVIGKLNTDDVVTVTGSVGEWYRISYDNKDVYIHGAYLKDYTETDYKIKSEKLKRLNDELNLKINNAIKALN